QPLSLSLLFHSSHPSTPDLSTLSLHDALPIYQLLDHGATQAIIGVAQQATAGGQLRRGQGVLVVIEVAAVLAVQVTDLTDRRHRSEEHTSELQSREKLVCRLLLEKKKHQRLNG